MVCKFIWRELWNYCCCLTRLPDPSLLWITYSLLELQYSILLNKNRHYLQDITVHSLNRILLQLIREINTEHGLKWQHQFAPMRKPLRKREGLEECFSKANKITRSKIIKLPVENPVISIPLCMQAGAQVERGQGRIFRMQTKSPNHKLKNCWSKIL